MAQATVKTVQFIDPRIEPQADPVYNNVIGPTQNQYYRINQSGLSNSSITFNNLTTLGTDRAYLDTFEIELEAEIIFHTDKSRTQQAFDDDAKKALVPSPDEWVFDSFPFNKCCEDVRVNINGGAFFSQPLSYLRAKERYMSERKLSECYENVCPIHKPYLQFESGRTFDGRAWDISDSNDRFGGFKRSYAEVMKNSQTTVPVLNDIVHAEGVPSRYGPCIVGYQHSPEGLTGGYNNSFIPFGQPLADGTGTTTYYMRGTNNEDTVVHVRWREPLFVSPFSSRYDATYGRPLYNITSMDMTFNLQNLKNMIKVSNLHHRSTNSPHVLDYNINIKSAFLCYQVMTIPASITKPLTTLVPYRRFVPYITDAPRTFANNTVVDDYTIKSGVYTLNEIPTAIWVFCAPSKKRLQEGEPDTSGSAFNADDLVTYPNWESNKLFAFMKSINITLANTTQILNTAQPYDLYRIAKANGCEDSYRDWAIAHPVCWNGRMNLDGTSHFQSIVKATQGCGSVLRLIPGVDIIIPDQALIPGANANNMVFQCEATFDLPDRSAAQTNYSLWLLFEYVGVAAISPGQCEITMNPLGSGEVMAVSPVLTTTSATSDGTLEGSGWLDKVRAGVRAANKVAEQTKILSSAARQMGFGKAADFLERHGYGEPGVKRARNMKGGAVLGLGDWT